MRATRFDGGLVLPSPWIARADVGIRRCSLPAQLVLPLRAPQGATRRARVRAGESVTLGQCLATAATSDTVPLIAPACGVVIAIEPRAVAHASGALEPCIVLAVHGVNAPTDEATDACWEMLDRAELHTRIRDAGVVGLGGAAFPTATKLGTTCELLIVNGIECEPPLSCDDALLRERSHAVAQGARVLLRALEARRGVIAVSAGMDESIAAIRAAIASTPEFELAILPARYPQGGERQLIQSLTGREVPQPGLPQQLGIRVHNVATAAACWQAVAHRRPLDSRIVTVAGSGVARPGNYEVAFGTPITHLVEQAGGYLAGAHGLVHGGALTGMALPHDDIPVTAATHGVLVLGNEERRAREPERPCIRCGDCANVCPARLLPQQLHWRLRRGDDAEAIELGLMACIECGACDLVCPSAIPLTQRFHIGKVELQQRRALLIDAEAARTRYVARNLRLERDALERANEQAERREQGASADAVQAALERARARKRSRTDAGS